MLLALALGFAVAGACSLGLPACHQPSAELRPAQRRPERRDLRAVPLLMLSAPFLIMRNTILGRRQEGRRFEFVFWPR